MECNEEVGVKSKFFVNKWLWGAMKKWVQRANFQVYLESSNNFNFFGLMLLDEHIIIQAMGVKGKRMVPNTEIFGKKSCCQCGLLLLSLSCPRL